MLLGDEFDKEYKFRDWYKNWASQAGLPDNPDDPANKDYDYRMAFDLGIEPVWEEKTKQFVWPDAASKKKIKKPTEMGEDVPRLRGVWSNPFTIPPYWRGSGW